MLRRFACLLTIVAAVFVTTPRASSKSLQLELTIDGADFAVNGSAKFLPIISYFDAIHGDLPTIDADFAALKAAGFEGVRIFPNWYRLDGPPDSSNTNFYRAQDTLFDKDGNLRSATLSKVLTILDLAKENDLIVDLSFSIETVVDCPLDNCTSGTTALTFAEYKGALEAFTTVLSNAGSAYKHVMFDLQNEYNTPNNKPNDLSSWNYGQMDELAEAIHAIEPSIIVFASWGFGVDPTDAANDADNGDLDVAILHEPRDVNWGNDSDGRAIAMHVATSLPIYFQESPRYRATGLGSDTTCWFDNVQAAKSLYEAKVNGGVAAWNFHTAAGFNLNGSWTGWSIYDNFVSTESTFVNTTLAATLSCSGSCPTGDLTYGQNELCSTPAHAPEPVVWARRPLQVLTNLVAGFRQARAALGFR